MAVYIDIGRMAEELNVTPARLLSAMCIVKGGWKRKTAIAVGKKRLQGKERGLAVLQELLYVSAHFVVKQ